MANVDALPCCEKNGDEIKDGLTRNGDEVDDAATDTNGI